VRVSHHAPRPSARLWEEAAAALIFNRERDEERLRVLDSNLGFAESAKGATVPKATCRGTVGGSINFIENFSGFRRRHA
jgi:hypothetical protein